jgi:hypothetical protein
VAPAPATTKPLKKNLVKIIETELLWQRSLPTRRAAEIANLEYINGFYSPRRRDTALGCKSPIAHEAKAAQI